LCYTANSKKNNFLIVRNSECWLWIFWTLDLEILDRTQHLPKSFERRRAWIPGNVFAVVFVIRKHVLPLWTLHSFISILILWY
jgi:hypothetical protein